METKSPVDIKSFERFADVVRAVRRERGLSQREMARQLSVSAGYVGQWELGLSKPSADLVRRICRTFALTEEDHVLRLAYAETAPDYLKNSIVRYQSEGLSPTEQKALALVRSVPPGMQEQLCARMQEWADLLSRQQQN